MNEQHAATVEIHAADYGEALAFCNERLAEIGKPRITTLPPGIPGDARSCPCASAVGNIWVERFSWMWLTNAGVCDSPRNQARARKPITFGMAAHPIAFTRAFDEAGRAALKAPGQDLSMCSFRDTRTVLPIRKEPKS